MLAWGQDRVNWLRKPGKTKIPNAEFAIKDVTSFLPITFTNSLNPSRWVRRQSQLWRSSHSSSGGKARALITKRANFYPHWPKPQKMSLENPVISGTSGFRYWNIQQSSVSLHQKFCFLPCWFLLTQFLHFWWQKSPLAMPGLESTGLEKTVERESVFSNKARKSSGLEPSDCIFWSNHCGQGDSIANGPVIPCSLSSSVGGQHPLNHMNWQHELKFQGISHKTKEKWTLAR